MKLMETASRFLRNAEALANALDYDPLADLGLRVRRLELDSQSQQARLEPLSGEVDQIRRGR